MDDSLYNELLVLEHRGWQSLCDGDGAQFYGASMGSVYIRVEGTWRLAHYQQTPIPSAR